MGTAGDRCGRRGLLRQRIRRGVGAAERVASAVHRMPAERRRILPPLAEDRLDVVDGRTGDGGLHVVPGRALPVRLRHRLGLRVAEMPGVVPARVAQVDPADVGDVPLRPAPVADHHQLLVMRPAGPDPHVEQHLGPVALQLLAGLPVLGGGEGQDVEVRAPDQPANVDAADVGRRQQLLHGRFGFVGQLLVGVAAPVGEVDDVAGLGLLDPLAQFGEVGRPVHQRPDVIARRPGLFARDSCASRTLWALPRSVLVSSHRSARAERLCSNRGRDTAAQSHDPAARAPADGGRAT